MKFKARMGYLGAGLTLAAALLAPFALYGLFTKGFTHLGLRVSETYTGGPIVRTLAASGYTIGIHQRVPPHMLQREKTFVQLDWKPAAALPPHVSDVVDIDGDGQADVRIDFDVPRDLKAPLHGAVQSLNPLYEDLPSVGKAKFSVLIVRVDDAIVVRVPLAR